MASIHHPQIHGEESGLCGCESISFNACFMYLFPPNILRVLIVSCASAWSRVCILSAVPEMPNLATVSASTYTPATPLWSTGVCLSASRNKWMHAHIHCITQHRNLWLHSDDFSLAPGASTTLTETFWLVRKRTVGVCTVISHENNDSSNPRPSSSLKFSFLRSSLSVCLCSPTAGWDLDHHRVWENDGRAERDLCHPGEVHSTHVLFLFFSKSPVFPHTYLCIVSALASHLLYLERYSLVLFRSDLKNK